MELITASSSNPLLTQVEPASDSFIQTSSSPTEESSTNENEEQQSEPIIDIPTVKLEVSKIKQMEKICVINANPVHKYNPLCYVFKKVYIRLSLF